MIHAGWRIVANPLYGNLKPNQQPYRTLVLTKEEERSSLDLESLELIESAIRIHENSHILMLPGSLPLEVDKDLRYIDFMLIEETLKSSGLFVRPLVRYARGDFKRSCVTNCTPASSRM